MSVKANIQAPEHDNDGCNSCESHDGTGTYLRILVYSHETGEVVRLMLCTVCADALAAEFVRLNDARAHAAAARMAWPNLIGG